MSGSKGAIMKPSVPTAKVPRANHRRGAMENGARTVE
jgi:hypothetical protein